jgi:hypothetical protein
MQQRDDLKRGDIVADEDELLIIEQTPTLSDDSYVVSSFEKSDDLVDDETGYAGTDVDVDASAGIRSMGAAVGTQHRHAEADR